MGMGDSSGRTTHIGIESGTIGCTTTQVRRRREGAQRGTESKDRQRNLNIELERGERERGGRGRGRGNDDHPSSPAGATIFHSQANLSGDWVGCVRLAWAHMYASWNSCVLDGKGKKNMGDPLPAGSYIYIYILESVLGKRNRGGEGRWIIEAPSLRSGAVVTGGGRGGWKRRVSVFESPIGWIITKSVRKKGEEGETIEI